jgi:quercetin dioxygenase-like cupin family protein
MDVFNLRQEARWDPLKHVEHVLGRIGEGDVTVACWEAGQTSPHHLHPNCTEIYVCLEGGGTMRTPDQTVAIVPGAFVVHPRGELHEYENGPGRTLLFRVRYGADMSTLTKEWRGNPAWKPKPEDIAHFGLTAVTPAPAPAGNR